MWGGNRETDVSTDAAILGDTLSHVHAAGKSRRSKGKHRKAKQHREAYAWLGAGAITLGVGAAMVGGAGVAHAEDGSNGTDNPSSSNPSDPSPSSPGSNSTTTVGNSGLSSAVKESAETVVNTVKDTGGSGTTLTTKSNEGSPKTTVSFSGGFQQSEVKEKADPVDPPKKQADPVVVEDVQPVTFTAPEVNQKQALEVEPDPPAGGSVQLDEVDTLTQYVEPDQIEPVSASNASFRTMALVSTQAVDPARAAYLQQFRNADPTDQFFTPASAAYKPAPPDAQYLTIGEVAAILGTTGFSRDAQNNLVYTNRTSQPVAVIYAQETDQEPEGIRIVAPGRSVTVPGGSTIAALAEGPKISARSNSVVDANVLAVGGPGYPPERSVTPAPTTPAAPVAKPPSAGGSSYKPPTSTVKPVSKPAPPKIDINGQTVSILSQVLSLLDEVKKITSDAQWAEAVHLPPEMGALVKKAVGLVATSISLLKGSNAIVTGQHPYTGPLNLASGMLGGVSLGVPVLTPQSLGIRLGLMALSVAVGVLADGIELANPNL